MYVETFTFFGLLTLILFVFAEIGRHKILGVMASLLLIMAGIWVGGDNITFPTGTSATVSEVNTAVVVGNTTTSTLAKNQTQLTTYAPITIPYTPIAFNILLALIFVSVGIYGSLYYALYVVR